MMYIEFLRMVKKAIRKQVYIESHQDRILKKKARELGITEAELVRRALEAHLEIGIASGRDMAAWEKEKSFIVSRIELGHEKGRALQGGRRTWRRDEFYEC
jgi:hypothetical protein